jgi:hypothetical protein
MVMHRACMLAVAASALLSLPHQAAAASFDGSWNMVAVTTRGHCGTVDIGLGVKRGRLFATSGFFAFYPITITGSVSGSGNTHLTAIAGPRIAHGTGRFRRDGASGTWKGKGPSGLCSGVWRASRS